MTVFKKKIKNIVDFEIVYTVIHLRTVSYNTEKEIKACKCFPHAYTILQNYYCCLGGKIIK